MTKKASERQRRDVVTLPDLAPRHRVSGGSARRVFGAEPLAQRPEDNAIAGKKDLPAKKDVKGGKIMRNDSLTLARAAKPAKKDLPAGKDVKGGRIARNDNLTLVRAR